MQKQTNPTTIICKSIRIMAGFYENATAQQFYLSPIQMLPEGTWPPGTSSPSMMIYSPANSNWH